MESQTLADVFRSEAASCPINDVNVSTISHDTSISYNTYVNKDVRERTIQLLCFSHLWNLLTIPGSMQTILWYSSSSKSAKLCQMVSIHEQNPGTGKQKKSCQTSMNILRQSLPNKIVEKKKETKKQHKKPTCTLQINFSSVYLFPLLCYLCDKTWRLSCCASGPIEDASRLLLENQKQLRSTR